MLATSALPLPALAESWTLKPQQHKELFTYRYYATDRYLDSTGRSIGKPGQFRKHAFTYYVEYGWREDWTLGGALTASHQQDVQQLMRRVPGQGGPRTEDVFREVQVRGMERSSLFLRHQLYRADGLALAAQATLTTPPVYSSGSVTEGVVLEEGSGEGLLALGYSVPQSDRAHYLEGILGYRHRLGPLNDQLRLRVQAGLQLSERWTLMPLLAHTEPVGGIDVRATTITGGNDFALTTAELSLGYRVMPGVTLVAGGFRHLDGRNIGGGGGLITSLWLQW